MISSSDIIVTGVEAIEAALAANRSIVLAMIHQGPGLRILQPLRSRFPNVAGCHIYRRLGNAELPKLEPATESANVRLFEATNTGIRALLRFAKEQPTIIAMMVDIYVPNESAIFVPFFGRQTLCMPGAAFLAQILEAAILPCLFVQTDANETPHAKIFPEVKTLNSSLREATRGDIMAELYKVIEEHLTEHPAGWEFWHALNQRSV